MLCFPESSLRLLGQTFAACAKVSAASNAPTLLGRLSIFKCLHVRRWPLSDDFVGKNIASLRSSRNHLNVFHLLSGCMRNNSKAQRSFQKPNVAHLPASFQCNRRPVFRVYLARCLYLPLKFLHSVRQLLNELSRQSIETHFGAMMRWIIVYYT